MRKKQAASRKPISADTFVTHFPVPTVPFGVNAVPGGATPSTALPPISSGQPRISQDKSVESSGDAGFDLNRLLVEHPAATFFLRAKGDALMEAGVRNGDVLIVDRSLEPVAGRLVVAVVNGEFTVQYFHRIQKKLFASSAKNPAGQKLQKEPNVEIWGVVTYVIHPA
jgi:DNA polymerase V